MNTDWFILYKALFDGIQLQVVPTVPEAGTPAIDALRDVVDRPDYEEFAAKAILQTLPEEADIVFLYRGAQPDLGELADQLRSGRAIAELSGVVEIYTLASNLPPNLQLVGTEPDKGELN